MGRSRVSAYTAVYEGRKPIVRGCEAGRGDSVHGRGLPMHVPLGRITPYNRCKCGACRECIDNAKWDRIFKKFEATEDRDIRGMFQCALNDF